MSCPRCSIASIIYRSTQEQTGKNTEINRNRLVLQSRVLCSTVLVRTDQGRWRIKLQDRTQGWHFEDVELGGDVAKGGIQAEVLKPGDVRVK